MAKVTGSNPVEPTAFRIETSRIRIGRQR